MRFTKPAWVMHQDGRSENPKRLSIFSVHVHPDGSRIATGGLDAKVRIWSTKPILNQSSEVSGKPPKSLCTLAMHTGPILTVRWAHSGRWLASGSDDQIIMIWDLDPHGSGRVWGSDEVNVEGWKPLKRLPGHESDITDLAWSPEDRYLASTGLDSKVMIWCGFTLERLAKLDLHQGFVKGVCWDPVGEFLATQSDDRTVRIWRTQDWGLEATVDKPFAHSPGSTFFRRLSWSPDGAHITASNATNNNGFVFVAAVITRGTWTSDISLVGHENTVEVAAYNPHVFLRDPKMPVVTANICSVVALGADDRSVSVWQTKSARPLIVAKEVFERNILDLSWSWDGLTLYAVSSDGTMGVFNFDKEELEGIAPREAQTIYLRKFGFTPPPLPPGYSHFADMTNAQNLNGHATSAVNGAGMNRSTPPLTPPPQGSSQPPSMTNGFGFVSGSGQEQVNTLVARKGGKNKKRVQPTFVGALGSSVPSAGSSTLSAPVPSANVPTSSLLLDTNDGPHIRLPPPPLQSLSRSGFGSNAFYADPRGDGPDVAMLDSYGNDTFLSERGTDMEVPISSFDTRSRRGGEDSVAKIPKARTLGGGDRPRNVGDKDIKEIRPAGQAPNIGMSTSASIGYLFPPPSLKTYISVRVEDTGDIFEAKNSEDGRDPTELTLLSGKDKTVQWLDYLPAPAVSLVGTARFCAVAMEDGSVIVYSHTGRRLMPTIALGYPIAYFDACKQHLLAITSTGIMHVWNIKTLSAIHPPVTLSALLSLLTPSLPTLEHPNGISLTVSHVSVRSNGAALVQLSDGTAMSYDRALMTWVRLSDPWWASGSTCWKGRQRASSSSVASTINNTYNSAQNGVVTAIESRISEANSVSIEDAEKVRPEWWGQALTLGHLEARMHAARVLESAAEYRQALILYARVIADEGFRGKAEELLRELYGPVYWRPGKVDDNWSPIVLGMQKRDLAKDVLAIFARSKSLFKLAQDYQDLLKKSALDD